MKIIQHTENAFSDTLLMSDFCIWRSPRFFQHAKWYDTAPNVHLEDGSEQVLCLKQTCLQTGEARKYLTTGLSLMCFSWITQSRSTSTRLEEPTKIPRPGGCGLANYLLIVSRCSSSHCRLHSCPVRANNLAESFRPLLLGTKKAQKNRHVISDMN